MSAEPPPPPRKRRPEEGLVGAPPRTRTRAEQAAQNAKAAKVFEAMSTWHMGAERRTAQDTYDTWQGTHETHTSHRAVGHDKSLFIALTNLANTNTQSRAIFTQRKAGLRDASKTAMATKITKEGGDVEYTNRSTEGPGNPRSRRMMAEMQARDEAGRFANEKQ